MKVDPHVGIVNVVIGHLEGELQMLLRPLVALSKIMTSDEDQEAVFHYGVIIEGLVEHLHQILVSELSTARQTILEQLGTME